MNRQGSVVGDEINCHGMTWIKAGYSNKGLTSGQIGFLELMQGFCGFDTFD